MSPYRTTLVALSSVLALAYFGCSSSDGGGGGGGNGGSANGAGNGGTSGTGTGASSGNGGTSVQAGGPAVSRALRRVSVENPNAANGTSTRSTAATVLQRVNEGMPGGSCTETDSPMARRATSRRPMTTPASASRQRNAHQIEPAVATTPTTTIITMTLVGSLPSSS